MSTCGPEGKLPRGKIHLRRPSVHERPYHIYCGAKGPSTLPSFGIHEHWDGDYGPLFCKKCPTTALYKQDKQDAILGLLAKAGE